MTLLLSRVPDRLPSGINGDADTAGALHTALTRARESLLLAYGEEQLVGEILASDSPFGLLPAGLDGHFRRSYRTLSGEVVGGDAGV